MILIEWYVYYHDFNRNKIIKRNIFNNSLRKEIEKIKIDSNSKEEFSEKLDSKMKYYFWSRCEYEVVVTGLFVDTDKVKIDIYDQLRMNWHAFVDYVWSFRTIDE